jgi:hypothetical protein
MKYSYEIEEMKNGSTLFIILRGVSTAGYTTSMNILALFASKNKHLVSKVNLTTIILILCNLLLFFFISIFAKTDLFLTIIGQSYELNSCLRRVLILAFVAELATFSAIALILENLQKNPPDIPINSIGVHLVSGILLYSSIVAEWCFQKRLVNKVTSSSQTY